MGISYNADQAKATTAKVKASQQAAFETEAKEWVEEFVVPMIKEAAEAGQTTTKSFTIPEKYYGIARAYILATEGEARYKIERGYNANEYFLSW